MPAFVHTDITEIASVVGPEFVNQLTYPGIYRGAPRSVTPVMVETAGHRTIVISDADSQAARALPEDVSVIRYGRYFTFENDPSSPIDFAEAVRQAANGKDLVADGRIPKARLDALAGLGPVELGSPSENPVVFVYSRPLSQIEAQWLAARERDCAPLGAYLADFPHGDALKSALFPSPKGFSPLAKLCIDNRINALCITAPHEIEALTGLPDATAAKHGVIAVYAPTSDHITIGTSVPFEHSEFTSSGEPLLLSHLLTEYEMVAAQKNDMSAALWRGLEEAGIALCEGDTILRRWQDLRAGDDFGYFVLAANAVIAGMAEARDFFESRRESSLTERDLTAACQQGIARFAARFGFEGRVSTYFNIVHSGARTLLPATAADYPVSHDDRTIAFDQGIVVRDSAGCVRAVSDIARTICAEQELTDIYLGLRQALIDDLIPRIRPGMTGEQIHAIGVECLQPLEPKLRAAGLLPAGKGVEAYTRDCGHAIQRQTISSVYFVPGNLNVMEEHMLGCVEYVWAIGDVLLGVEEGYVVTPSGTYPFTREAA